jgi:hypothetical protein
MENDGERPLDLVEDRLGTDLGHRYRGCCPLHLTQKVAGALE